jgi:hypothetical protein
MSDELADSEQQTGDTVGARLVAAGLSPERIAQHLAAGFVVVDGRVVKDLSESAPWPQRIVINPEH